MNTAVLIIDVQQGLCEGPSAAYDCAATIKRINSVSQHARDSGVPVIFNQHESGPGYLEYKTASWQLANGLESKPSDLYVRKTTPDAFLRTELLETLEKHHITEVIVCGMHTEFCVDTTIRKALALGYPVTLVSDAHTSAGNSALTPQQVIDHHNLTLTNISSFGPKVTTLQSHEIHLSA